MKIKTKLIGLLIIAAIIVVLAFIFTNDYEKQIAEPTDVKPESTPTVKSTDINTSLPDEFLFKNRTNLFEFGLPKSELIK